MMATRRLRTCWAAATVIAATAIACGCAKKEDNAPIAEASGAASKKKDDPVIAQNLQMVQKDLSAKDYEKAAASIMQMQDMAPMMSERDAEKFSAQMRNVQGSVAQAAAAGDPKAQSAVAMLRMMSRENQMPMRR